MPGAKSNPQLLKLVRWLESGPSLEELQEKYPSEWAAVEQEFGRALRDRDKRQLDRLLRPGLPKHARFGAIPGIQLQAIRSTLVKQRMTAIALERGLKASFTEEKAIHIGWLDRFLLRCVFFGKDYRRRLVSDFLYSLIWPAIRQKKYLPHLAEAHGVYCFYSKRLVAALSEMLRDKPCVEIAAGDGALSRFLRDSGIDIMAFDNQSWTGKVRYNAEVIQLDAVEALRRHKPEVVLCSWPPANNEFEQEIFLAPTVTRYIVIGSDNRLTFGNWPAYMAQRTFQMRKDEALSDAILPSRSGGAVYVFERRFP